MNRKPEWLERLVFDPGEKLNAHKRKQLIATMKRIAEKLERGEEHSLTLALGVRMPTEGKERLVSDSVEEGVLWGAPAAVAGLLASMAENHSTQVAAAINEMASRKTVN